MEHRFLGPSKLYDAPLLFIHDSLPLLFPFYRKQKIMSEFIFSTSFTLSVFTYFNGMKESTLKPIIISVVLYVLPQS